MDLLKNLDNMITAKKFIVSNEVKQGFLLTNSTDELKDIIKSHIEFAKLHVEAALKAASEKAEWKGHTLAAVEICDYSILDAYPLENIK